MLVQTFLEGKNHSKCFSWCYDSVNNMATGYIRNFYRSFLQLKSRSNKKNNTTSSPVFQYMYILCLSWLPSYSLKKRRTMCEREIKGSLASCLLFWSKTLTLASILESFSNIHSTYVSQMKNTFHSKKKTKNKSNKLTHETQVESDSSF